MSHPFSARLRILREQQGMTKRALARAVGVSTASVCHWEAGSARPRQHSVTALASALDVSSTYLMLGAELEFARERLERQVVQTLGDVIDEAKQRIAALAGTVPAKVTISLEY